MSKDQDVQYDDWADTVFRDTGAMFIWRVSTWDTDEGNIPCPGDNGC
jgi:hypothetical protein